MVPQLLAEERLGALESSKSSLPFRSEDMKAREEEIGRNHATLVLALPDLPPYKDDMSFEKWFKTVKIDLRLLSARKLPNALLKDLFLAAIDVDITPDTDIDQCCDTSI
ncbi:RNA directed DNA polymerase (reverse transcriptase) [Echinococcus multilocularis]|uniref:RNA directed DNA polymerase (Reverse transcriptase) n=1 Tax=Echinococcus multilocularis TaxID=6211 RepID=A0A0S4MLH7_ECHMU|nr:RNA directed DNA polymerase (reverse transcriptase) [Echinococcus multilocularis]